MVAGVNQLTSVVSTKCWKIERYEKNVDRRAETLIKCQDSVRSLALFRWHFEGWSERNEELVMVVQGESRARKNHQVIAGVGD